ncbi:MAG: zinc-ribbon domain-containing protein [Clostridia bacterium]|nr:zinc-ribbon domain-containing protein [Clostridia bacterium]
MINIIEEENNCEIEEKENIDNKKKVNKKYCTKCGKIIENEWAFCNFCGNKLK